MGQQRYTRQQAAEHLGVSLTTVDRMVRRGEVQMERDGPGERARVWVLLDEEHLGSSPGAPNGAAPVATGASLGEPAVAPRDAEVELLKQQVQHLEELSAYRAQLLQEAELRYHELLQQFTRVLPPPKEKRRWWPFRRG